MALWGIVAAVALACAQNADEDRLKKLEEKVQKRQEEIDQPRRLKPGDKAPASSTGRCSASWRASRSTSDPGRRQR